MTLNALGAPRDAGPLPWSAPGFAGRPVGFDDLSRAIAGRRDAVLRDTTARAAAYPQPAHVSPAAAAGTLIGSAVAAFAGSEAGRAAIEHAVSAAAKALKGLIGTAAGAAEQLPLPLE